ncbi:ABC transporter substrate-binding protein [Variovorax paradoxus]|uniref:ABC transporter substrate-binding protein n=1 Tax=Variovorax paradoxus TaxID=34073 RepID=UPI0021ABFA79|nr:ABC transporter substrate-binding protein [Variovorax paradoxus]UVH58369.1 ABC transporter substrate-binding protein [Variovorax paradoxus]
MNIVVRWSVIAIAISTLAVSAQALTVVVGGGLQGDSAIKAFVEPFEKETGIKVNVVRDQATTASVKLKAQSGNMDFDVAGFSPAGGTMLSRSALLEPIDYARFNKAVIDKLSPESRKPWGVQFIYYSWVLGLDASRYPAGKPAPASWTDFWNVEKFPGTRVLQNGELGSQGPFEEALLADGVPMDKLYPLDADRAFRSLDKIKPHIRKYWKVGSEQMQIFSSGGAALGMGFDGRFTALSQSGKPMKIVWNQAKMTGLYWIIPKGAKNVGEAHKFIEFTLNPERQAAYVTLTGYSPANPDAFNFISKEMADTMVTSPQNRKHAYMVNDAWYSEVGPDGKSNGERLAQRWNEWITK